MGRPRIEWNDAQLLAIMNGIAAIDRDFPRDNARFLDGLIAEVRVITGRVFGATTYSRLLRDVAPQAGVQRHPSAPTVQQAILRAQALAPMAQPGGADNRPVDLELMRQALAPVVREALAPLYASQHERGKGYAGGAAQDRGDANAMVQQPLLQAALEDAHARIRRLEQESAQLHRELGEAHAARDLAGEHVNRLLGDLNASIERAGVGATTLAQTATQLAGTERFLKMQNDAVRLQASGEVDALRAQNGQLRERIDHLLLEVDQYRRTLSSRPPGSRLGNPHCSPCQKRHSEHLSRFGGRRGWPGRGHPLHGRHQARDSDRVPQHRRHVHVPQLQWRRRLARVQAQTRNGCFCHAQRGMQCQPGAALPDGSGLAR
jgi:hypothetical protein